MSASKTLAERISAQFEAREQQRKAAERDRLREAEQRERAIAEFNSACDGLRALWESKLAVFSEYFRDKLKVTPAITPQQRQVQLVFLTDLANMTMCLSASLSADLHKVVIDYSLLILPMFFEYERSARLEIPLDSVDLDAIERWVDDRLVSCAKAYLSVQDNQFYVERLPHRKCDQS